MKKQFNLIFFLVLMALCFSCVKEPIEPEKPQDVEIDTTYSAIGVYVLNEGLFNMNNSTLTFYNNSSSTAITDFFDIQNGRKLGDTGNDIAIYGNKMYIVVNVSSQLEVVNPYTGKSIKQIPFFNGNQPRQPRYIAFYKNKAFVCSFDGTVAVIDTASLVIEKFINVGRNPDGIAVVNNKVYVSNSGGLDYPNYDNTVSVIDANTLTEIKRIQVQINPYVMVPDKYGDLYVVSRGNYGDIKMCLQIIDTNTDELKYTFPNIEVLNLAINGDTAYVYYYDYVSGTEPKIMTINVKDETIINHNFISDGTIIQTPYGIAVQPITGDVFITDAKGFVNTGEVICFNKNGQKKYSFTAGLNPGHIAFLNTAKIDTLKNK
ncbi:MAG: YncE family protein [Bacteroidales bacterium]